MEVPLNLGIVSMEDRRALSKRAAIEVTPNGNEMVLRISGACGIECADKLDAEIQNQLKSGAKRLSLDFSKADYLETPVLRLIVDSARKLASAGTTLSVRRLSPAARKTFSLLKLDWLLSDEARKPS